METKFISAAVVNPKAELDSPFVSAASMVVQKTKGSEVQSRNGETESDPTLKIISVHQGGTFHIHLWEDRTRGEEWVPSYDAASLALVNDDFLRTTSNNAVDSGRRTFEFCAVRPGTHRLLFEKRLGWKFTAEDRRLFLVNVVESGDLSEHA
jgi:predicted secreted protein